MIFLLRGLLFLIVGSPLISHAMRHTCDMRYTHLRELFYTADPMNLESVLRECLPIFLQRRPERLSERLCALARLSMKTGNPGALDVVLGDGRCTMINPESMSVLHRKADKYGMQQEVARLCGNFPSIGTLGSGIGTLGSSIGAMIGGALCPHRHHHHHHRRHGWFGMQQAQMPFVNGLPIDILGTLTRHEAANFGFSGECSALTHDHFAFPGARISVVRALPLECFQSLSPACFSGMSRRMVRGILHWPHARPEQIAALSPHSIRGLNWELVGWGPQDPMMPDPMHPCSGVTPMQEMAIEPAWRKWQNYQARCQGAPMLYPYSGQYMYWTGGLFYVLIILFVVLLAVAAFL
jgi:hypothetical protein